jgi:hypothetical protein
MSRTEAYSPRLGTAVMVGAVSPSEAVPVNRSLFDLGGFTLVDCPTRNTKETLDKKIIVDAMHFAAERRSLGVPCCVCLISCDGDYSYMLNRLR